MPQNAPASRAVVRPVQYLRAIAALMEVWHHSIAQIPGIEKVLPDSWGTSGVDLFLVISGFIMAAVTFGKDVTPWDFLRRRLVRVVPMYWLVTLAMVGLALVAPGLFRTLRVDAETLAMSLLFVPHWSAAFPGHAWSTSG